MRKSVLSLLLLLIGMTLYAQDPDGKTCATAIPLGKDYQKQVLNGQEIWYSAWTFDLPLSVYFAPEHGSADPAPVVAMDFSCTSGFYEDSILCSLFCKTSGASGISFQLPHEPPLKTKTLDDGTFVYYLSLGKDYRDLLLQMGISYNLEVFVKVTYKSNGKIAMAPDDMFTNCMDGAKFMHLGDTVRVAAKDKERHVIVPYVQWQEDTIAYKWEGTTSCEVAIANTCEFDPTSSASTILDYRELQPGDSLKVTATLLAEYVKNQKDYPNEAGMYFAKFYSTAPGVITIKKMPQAPPKAKATLLRFDRTYPLNANETGVFAISKSWDDAKVDSKFATPTDHIFRMYLATDPDFSEEHMLQEYQFEKYEEGHWQGIFGSAMHEFWKKAIDQYLYIRFECTEATTITPSEWTASECVKNSTKAYIQDLDTTFKVDRATDVRYRLLYSQWKGGDLTITFSQKQKCEVYFATDCNITRDPQAANVLYAKDLTSSATSVTIPASEIANWAERVDDEGYIYARFHHGLSTKAYITLHSTAPEEKDPTYPAATIAVKCEGTKVIVSVREAQEIVITEAATGTEKDRWNAEPSQNHELNLPVGIYTLQGKKEQITINL